MSRALRIARPGFSTGRSESEPIVMAMRGWVPCEGVQGMDFIDGWATAVVLFRSARRVSVRVIRFEMACSAAGMDSWRRVMWPIFRPGLGSLPYMWRAVFDMTMASFKMPLCESALIPPSMVSMIAAETTIGIFSGTG